MSIAHKNQSPEDQQVLYTWRGVMGFLVKPRTFRASGEHSN